MQNQATLHPTIAAMVNHNFDTDPGTPITMGAQETLNWLNANIQDVPTYTAVNQFIMQMDGQYRLSDGMQYRANIFRQNNRLLEDGTLTDLYAVTFVVTDAPLEITDFRDIGHYRVDTHQFYLVVGQDDAPTGFVPAIQKH